MSKFVKHPRITLGQRKSSTNVHTGIWPECQHTPPLDEVRHFGRPRDGTASPLVECIYHPLFLPPQLEQLRRHRV